MYRVTYNGNRYLFIETTRDCGGLCTEEQFVTGDCDGFAFMRDGVLYRFGKPIGDADDLTDWEECEAPTPLPSAKNRVEQRLEQLAAMDDPVDRYIGDIDILPIRWLPEGM